jgi:hypothetical protein
MLTNGGTPCRWNTGWVLLLWLQITFFYQIWVRVKIVTSWGVGIFRNWLDWDHSSFIDWSFGWEVLFWVTPLSLITLDSGSRLSRIEVCAFDGTGLVSIILPSSVEVFSEHCFSQCRSFSSVTFESGSRLSRIEWGAFYETGLIEIILPSSVEVLGKNCFNGCESLSSVTFVSWSRLMGIEREVRHQAVRFGRDFGQRLGDWNKQYNCTSDGDRNCKIGM